MKRRSTATRARRDRGGPPPGWWFIVAEEHSPARERPLIVNSLTQQDPIEWLMDYSARYPHAVHILFFARIYRTPTKAEREALP